MYYYNQQLNLFALVLIETLALEDYKNNRTKRWWLPKYQRSWASKKRWRCLRWRQVRMVHRGTKWRFQELNETSIISALPRHLTTTPTEPVAIHSSVIVYLEIMSSVFYVVVNWLWILCVSNIRTEVLASRTKIIWRNPPYFYKECSTSSHARSFIWMYSLSLDRPYKTIVI